MINYAKGGSIGDNTQPVNAVSPAPVKALEQYYAENTAVSSVITLTENTTAIEIAAGPTPVIMRWVSVADGTTAATSVIALPLANANFDHVIPANTVRRFVVPIEGATNQQAGATTTSMVGARVEYNLFARVAYKPQSIGSVYVAEYGKSNSY